MQQPAPTLAGTRSGSTFVRLIGRPTLVLIAHDRSSLIPSSRSPRRSPFRFPVIPRQRTTTPSTCCVPVILALSIRLRSQSACDAASGGDGNGDGLSQIGSGFARRQDAAHGTRARNSGLA